MKMKTAFGALIALSLYGAQARAQTGVDDDRVSLPEGPGSLEGVGDNVEIDPNMGSMRYSVPIKLPAGRQGLSPDLSLSYASSAPAGSLGIGWSMPQPTIERMTSRRVPLYDTSDFMAADGGTELVLVKDEGNDLVYRERFERSFKRYTWVSHAGGAKGHWKVEQPDGIVAYYGATAEGVLVESALTLNPQGQHAKYHLVEQVDPFGNRVRYTYDKFGAATPHMTQVQWVFDVLGQPLYRATLSWQQRPDPISDANLGFEEVLGYRLKGVEVFALTELMREYELNYEDTSTSGGFSRLTQVTEFGLGGKTGGVKNPIEFSFEYQRALGAQCTQGDCDKPYMVEIPNTTGASLGSGRATLVDINGDALPDILDTSDTSAHKFYLNELVADGQGGFTQRFSAGLSSAVATNGAMQLSQNVQTLDINGDGYSDLVDLNAGTFLLKAKDINDWQAGNGSINVSDLRNFAAQDRRFLDYDNDKRIDVIVATDSGTQILENTGAGFVSKNVQALGAGFATTNLQMADMNGDGMSDPVRLSSAGQISYRLNLGRGQWADWRTLSGVSLTSAEVAIAELEDLNGDGRDDLVVVSTNELKYALNRGDKFEPFVTITSANIEGDLPERTNATVLYADMNANGSEDIVWFKDGEPVRFLELFPRRPNLLSKVDNGIGFIQQLTYSTAAEQAALADAAGKPWARKLQLSMPIIVQSDSFVTLTGAPDGNGLHDITQYNYQDGFYDGVEKQFRGFETVSMTMPQAQSQQEGTTTNVYDLGAEDVYYNGLLLGSQVYTGGQPVQKTTNSYKSCDLAQVPSPSELEALGRYPVKYICQDSVEVLHQEGAPQAQWLTTRMRYEYDGYGNITKDINEGIIDKEGDEMTTQTTYAAPTNLWHLRLPLKQEVYDEANGDRKETTSFYDGEDFVGSTQVTHGFLSRQMTKVDNSGKQIHTQRQKRDQYGNSVETIDPNGTIEDATTHRRSYTYDSWGLFLSQTDLHLEDEQGPYLLRRESRFDLKWQQPIQLSDWVLVRDGEVKTAANPRSVVYDELGRQNASLEFGDDESTPTTQYNYKLQDPISSVTVQRRSASNGAADLVEMRCFDGRGKLVQTRTKLSAQRWLVTGFTAFNSRGAEVEVYQPFESSQAECDDAPPAQLEREAISYDALFRKLTVTKPDGSIYGDASTERWDYGPLQEAIFDSEDLDPMSAHANTPLVRVFDGQQRIVELRRALSADQTSAYQLSYDNTGSFTGYTDPKGNRHVMEVDLADRVVSVTNPNFGAVKLSYDDAGNQLQKEDARGIVTQTTYDGQNRILEKWRADKRDETLIQWGYDVIDGCPATECTYTASRLGSITYPLELSAGQRVRAQRLLGYDTRQRLVFDSVSWAGLKLVSKRAYDNVDRAISMTYPDGTKVEPSYDGANRPMNIKGLINEVGYSARSMVERIEFGNGAKTTLTFDELLRPKTLLNEDAQGTVLEAFEYEYDRMNNLTLMADTSGRQDVSNASATLRYDAWYRLLEAQLSQGQQDAEALAFEYDELDNIISLTSSLDAKSPAHVGAMSYDATKPNAIIQASALAYEYDKAGQMTKRGQDSFDWDYAGRMMSSSSSALSTRYLYGDDERLIATISPNQLLLYKEDDFELRDGISYTYARINTQRVARIASDALMTELYPDASPDGIINAADAWSLLQRQTPADGATFKGTMSAEQLLGAAAARLLFEQEDAKVYLQSDHLGSLTIATDEGGELRGQRSFYPTGSVRWQQGDVDFYGFTGQEHQSSGLVRFQFRHLDPLVGRWASFDPSFMLLELAQLEKLGEATTGYAYVANNFLNAIDPLGLNKGDDSTQMGKGDNTDLSAATKKTIDQEPKMQDSAREREASLKGDKIVQGSVADNKASTTSFNNVGKTTPDHKYAAPDLDSNSRGRELSHQAKHVVMQKDLSQANKNTIEPVANKNVQIAPPSQPASQTVSSKGNVKYRPYNARPEK